MSSMQMPWLLTMQMSWLLTMQMSWLQTQQMSWLQTITPEAEGRLKAGQILAASRPPGFDTQGGRRPAYWSPPSGPHLLVPTFWSPLIYL